MSAVMLSGLTKVYDATTVISDASLTIGQGEFLTLLGPSGCGKTTLLRIVAGLVAPNSGTVTMDGRDVTSTPVHRREIGMVFQAHALFPTMNVGENVAFGLKMRGVSKAERKDRVVSALASVRLQDYINRMPHELSGGQQQRVAIARAIVIRPKVLLLDEPFGALDRKLREALQVELRDLTRSLSITAIFVTHDQEEALVLSDRIAVMNAGRIQQVATPRVIFEEPESRFVADFMGFANLRSAVVIDSDRDDILLDCSGLKLRAERGGRHPQPGQGIDVGIRRERIAIDPVAESSKIEDENAISGVIQSAIYHGNLWSYRVSTCAGELLVARLRGDGARSKGLSAGTAVALSWDKTAVRTFSSEGGNR
jgi:spermidine/putrescine ABC transporter ATP-binding subunit